MTTSLWTVFGSEVTGTAILILLGVGVHGDASRYLLVAMVLVFGVGFAEYFDGASNAWKAVRDAQAA